MRTFVESLLAPVTSARAISAVLLDDAGIRPQDIQHGVTIVETGQDSVVKGVVDLVEANAAPRQALIDCWKSFPSDAIAVFTNASKLTLGTAVENALTEDIPIVIAGHDVWIPSDLDDVCDRRLVVPERLTTDQIARIIHLVCPPADGEIVDITGVAEAVKILDIVKGVRKGFSASSAAAKLRLIAKHRRASDEARQDFETETSQSEEEFLASLGVKPPKPKPVKLSDLSGYGEARTWGLQLADDLRSCKSGEITFEECDRGILLSGPPGSESHFTPKH